MVNLQKETLFNSVKQQIYREKVDEIDNQDFLFEFSLNVFTELTAFSDKILVNTVKGLEPATQPPLVEETRMPAQCQQDTCERRDL